MIELVPLSDGQAQLGLAGDTYNTAAYLQRQLGQRAEVSCLTALGQDGLSDRIVQHVHPHDIGSRFVERRPHIVSRAL